MNGIQATGSLLTHFIKQQIRRVPFLHAFLRRLNSSFKVMGKTFNRFFPRRYYHIDLRPAGVNPLEKEALFSYIVHPMRISEGDPRFYRHINIWRTRQMIRILNDMGYRVDLINYTDKDFRVRKKYDLFIGHGGMNYARILSALSRRAVAVHFTTSNECHFRNKTVADRYADVSSRKGRVITPFGDFIMDREAFAVRRTDGIIGIGGDFSRKTYETFHPVFMVNNTALPDERHTGENRDFSAGRNHFLFFAGRDNVRKGLDLLLEVFSGLDQHLWICTYIDRDIQEIYLDELHHHANIHVVGHVQPRSDEFFSIVDRCNFTILPSCSEGQPHSVVEAMHFGLIPVVSRACSLEVGGPGKTLGTCSLDEIRSAVLECARMPASDCREKSRQIRELVQRDFSRDRFTESMKNALSSIIAQKSNG